MHYKSMCCILQVGSLAVDCFKESCPPLDCPLQEQVRPDALSCCKECRAPDPLAADPKAELVPVDPNKQHDMGVARSGLDILASGGCKWKGNYHENGDSWHPTVLPWGEMKCISCSCKVRVNGKNSVKKV